MYHYDFTWTLTNDENDGAPLLLCDVKGYQLIITAGTLSPFNGTIVELDSGDTIEKSSDDLFALMDELQMKTIQWERNEAASRE